jgi:hypothetical protein
VQCAQTLTVDPIRGVHILGAQNTFGKMQMVRTRHTVGARTATRWSTPMWNLRVVSVRFALPLHLDQMLKDDRGAELWYAARVHRERPSARLLRPSLRE